MCYMILTCGSLSWFLLTLVTDSFILHAIVSPKWLIGPESKTNGTLTNLATQRYKSVGINTR